MGIHNEVHALREAQGLYNLAEAQYHAAQAEAREAEMDWETASKKLADARRALLAAVVAETTDA